MPIWLFLFSSYFSPSSRCKNPHENIRATAKSRAIGIAADRRALAYLKGHARQIVPGFITSPLLLAAGVGAAAAIESTRGKRRERKKKQSPGHVI
jgi:hypothetical protein